MFGQIRLHARISRKEINKRIGIRQTVNPIHAAFPFALQDRRAVCLHCRNIAINHVPVFIRYSFCNGTKYIRHNFRYPQGVPAVPFLSVQKAFRTPYSTSALHRDISIIAQVSIFRYHSVRAYEHDEKSRLAHNALFQYIIISYFPTVWWYFIRSNRV